MRFRLFLENPNGLPSISAVNAILPQLAQAAQQVYDQWDQNEDGYDEELGGGGICQDIADAMAGVLNSSGIETIIMDNNGVGEQHVWCVVRVAEGVYGVDISPNHYETGGGYNWKKIPGVVFTPDYIDVYEMSKNPDDFDAYDQY